MTHTNGLETAEPPEPPFARFAGSIEAQSPLRAAITAACRRPEPDCVAPLLDLAASTSEEEAGTQALARRLVDGLRARGVSGGVEGLVQEYALSSEEGVALMCLAEALLRTPDAATRDALIRDKIAAGDWRAHLGRSPSLFVNAATWGLLVTGRMTATASETGLSAALHKLIARGGEPVIRKAVDLAMRLMGEQFVAGRDIAEALANARRQERRGFAYSYDMLGEAAATEEDAARYLASYENAIRAIGEASAGRGPYEGPGVSIKLSALHPRYSRQQRERVFAELLPRLKGLAQLAKGRDIGLNIDAEEADRLELSLDLFEALALDPALQGWDGLGFVIQAYGKRCPFVVDWIVDLARRAGRRLMVRLVKGAYWDSEIKRAQIGGYEDFPVFTRKVHTDVSYLACARKLLAARDAVFPQFATHNAHTLAAIMTMAGPAFQGGDYEFQCLHGMGEPLYEQVVGEGGLGRPCRIYAPVGAHETLLAYLVRRLLENGANSSFVNRIADPDVAVEDLIADPVAAARESRGAPHPKIARPPDLYSVARRNARGLDLADETALARLAHATLATAGKTWRAGLGEGEAVRNPADRRDIVGSVTWTTPEEIEQALAAAADAAPAWGALTAGARAAILRRAADAMEAAMENLIGLLVREAGKTFTSGVSEVREAVDFLRYYACEAERLPHDAQPLGVVAAISPWNFPLAIFTGQVAAALAAGNAVVAKPAEETPLIAAEAVRMLHAAGVPEDALRLALGAGETGAAIVADARVQGVLFTGSIDAAKSIQTTLARRMTRDGEPVTFIAETGGLNAMIVDSSALAEQVVSDVIASAFDSAGQRCSALRILCLQEDVAERTLAMLKGAMCELSVGRPDHLATDVGPVITEDARDAIEAHVVAMRLRGFNVSRWALPAEAAHGAFVAPTLIEISAVADVAREVFGPVLHVVRFSVAEIDRVVEAINAAGYGLTFGLHTRIDETIAQITAEVFAGNLYVNRNVIGAVVGVQPFGGSGLSGTGPKAGGPLYVPRLTKAGRGGCGLSGAAEALAPAFRYADWLADAGFVEEAERCRELARRSPLGAEVTLPGPVGERNVYTLRARGPVAALARTESGLRLQLGAILAAGCCAVVEAGGPGYPRLAHLPPELAQRLATVASWPDASHLAAILFEGSDADLSAVLRAVAERPGPIIPVLALTPESLAAGKDYPVERLLEERTISTNIAAAGGDATLMTIG
ncbi:trifunctional transcriptional regulator/proline dehydrogenase/L-glutamate gamma-semialdehyde dehydrogenase [Hansschlegelia quercus]|uniref:Bifunctional protein PutA n=1 Tax=Hansschlegelia quercus TaxID=2528245 RepID=A0A4Q9GKK8_9HYPH|nr:trifunctional transcriptional regulator/proline dehydrogenase/L-glutamate gamma-semialdehyde dehydrogenase [Hansschlegelia quercus]TBN54732.1 trifunctional transcriptional regulator/proline dehydrogenase/L-glutamate gamma-semialdehyde dehydrogenase [Hansschlegelia quercus]